MPIVPQALLQTNTNLALLLSQQQGIRRVLSNPNHTINAVILAADTAPLPYQIELITKGKRVSSLASDDTNIEFTYQLTVQSQFDNEGRAQSVSILIDSNLGQRRIVHQFDQTVESVHMTPEWFNGLDVHSQHCPIIGFVYRQPTYHTMIEQLSKVFWVQSVRISSDKHAAGFDLSDDGFLSL